MLWHLLWLLVGANLGLLLAALCLAAASDS